MKKRIKRYGLYFLVLGFMVPSVFNSFHVISHFSEKSHANCNHDHSGFSFDYPEIPGAEIGIFDNCTLCDFQLSDLKINALESRDINIKHQYLSPQSPVFEIVSFFNGRHTLLRAPPIPA